MSEPNSLAPGHIGNATLHVTAEHTARSVGSGCLDVLATPMLIAVMEAAAVNCVENHLADGLTSLGIEIDVRHIAPTPVGMTVTAIAKLTHVSERRLEFTLEARDDKERIGDGRHVRAVVDQNHFEDKVRDKSHSLEGSRSG